MRPRRFRLESVLRVRRFELDSAGAALGRATRSLAVARTTARERSRIAEDGSRRLERWVGDGLAAGSLRAASEGVSVLAADAEHARVRVADAARETVDARGRVLTARRRVRALEQLREHFEAQQRAEQERVVQRELDEIGGRLHRPRQAR